MKRTLKRESKGLEVVKMETNSFSTDCGANQGVMVMSWAVLPTDPQGFTGAVP